LLSLCSPTTTMLPFLPKQVRAWCTCLDHPMALGNMRPPPGSCCTLFERFASKARPTRCYRYWRLQVQTGFGMLSGVRMVSSVASFTKRATLLQLVQCAAISLSGAVSAVAPCAGCSVAAVLCLWQSAVASCKQLCSASGTQHGSMVAAAQCRSVPAHMITPLAATRPPCVFHQHLATLCCPLLFQHKGM
jgi:hypothetical protein